MSDKIVAVSKYIDPCSDWGFKRIFGTDANKDLLIAFLNALFQGNKHISNIKYNKNEHKGNIRNDRNIVYDISCKGNEQERFIIEMQRTRQEHFEDRAVFYACRCINDQARNEKGGKWDYNLKKVYMIGILDNFVLKEREDVEYFHDGCLIYRRSGDLVSDKIWFIFVELLNFKKADSALDTELDKWLYVLKNMSKMDEIPVCLQQPIFKKLFNIAEYINLTKEEQMSYDQDLKNKWDNYSALAYREKKGREEGIEEGERRKAISIARELKKMGLPLDQIAAVIELPIEEIVDVNHS